MREGAPGPRVLCVDDEPELLKGLKLQLRKVARVELAERASAALSALDEDGPSDVVVSDMRMPEMDGAQFLSEVRTRWPMTERILLTGQADVESTAAAVNQGGIVRMLTKPCPKEVLVDAVLSAAETARLRRVEHELLEGTLRGALGILGQILGLVSPPALQRTSRIESIVRQLATALELEEPWRYQVAAALSQVGCVAVPIDILDRIALGKDLDETQRDAFERHPGIAFDLVTRIPRLEDVAEMIRDQLEATDVNPDADPSSWPPARTGAELIRIATALDRLLSRGDTAPVAIGRLRNRKEHPEALLDALEGIELADEDRTRICVAAGTSRPG
ncbi:MAG: response regulator [Myxococcota bacterium]